MMPYMWRTAAAAGLGLACFFFGEGAARAGSADELLASAKRLEQAHDDELAARRYNEALSLDGSLAEAWLALGALRTRQGDHREAERVYAVCVARLPGLLPARSAHAEALHALGRTPGNPLLVVSQKTVLGLDLEDITVTVPATTGDKMIGPFP
ncbi:MAG TPA: hypothetical protein PLR99_10520, partial [Polyangiaceae bacterium]|nr:hypothetical protein [Polyangiaceae bacterium]